MMNECESRTGKGMHHEDEAQDEECSPLKYRNQLRWIHQEAACRQRSDAAGQGGSLPCHESLPSRCRFYHQAQPQE